MFKKSNKRIKLNESDEIADEISDDDNPDLSFKNNNIFFYCDVTKKSILTLINYIDIITFNNIKIAGEYSIEIPPIYLYINSDGGDIQAATSIIDKIKKSKVPIISIIVGTCASAATCISVVCQKRRITKYSTMMIHQISNHYLEYTQMSNKAMKDDLRNTNLLTKLMVDIYTEHSKMCPNDIKKALRNDILWSAEECLKNGFVDKID